MTWRDKLTGFYSILDRNDEQLARLLVRPPAEGGAGATVLQLRIKPSDGVTKRELVAAARMARSVTARVGALLIINDHVDIALVVDADGVHLGQRDLPLAEARQLADGWRRKREFLIGISTNRLDQVEAAARDGADYLGFGPVFATSTKANPDQVRGLRGLEDAVCAAGDTPVVAIGGITPTHADAIAATGAAAACCINAVNNSENPAVAGVTVGAPWRS